MSLVKREERDISSECYILYEEDIINSQIYDYYLLDLYLMSLQSMV